MRQYIRNLINYHKDEWKIQLIMKINFISSKDSEKTHPMHTASDNKEIMKCNEAEEIIEKLFTSLLEKYQKGLEEKMKGSQFVYDSINLLHYKLHKTSDCNWTRTHNHLVHKRTLNHLAKPAK